MPEEFKGKLECSGENTEKYITFSVPIKKEIVINDDDEKDDDIKEEEEEEEEEMIAIVKKRKLLILKKEKIIIVKKRKQSRTKYSLLIAIDLCQVNYQILLIIYLDFAVRNVNHVWKKN